MEAEPSPATPEEISRELVTASRQLAKHITQTIESAGRTKTFPQLFYSAVSCNRRGVWNNLLLIPKEDDCAGTSAGVALFGCCTAPRRAS